ncbi:hypothetical protein E1A91_D03G139300v1 [Gossypium mustelinum]|uniref:Aconitase/3-isopropylmalate dehydratase large subunit alpha/beta/alpha domain-containing protein n=1 Tax=Gossypium mustelinum TaxID=34275 RepID=A0A5D2VMH8_GOSMU|nr:hypothetical protein E1A91_D03G139300v1 [Gossypium mustelinum]
MGSVDEERSLLEAELDRAENSGLYTGDGSVDFNGNPVLKQNTGNWKACPFIFGNECCERLAYYGIATNLVSYLTKKLHEGNASAARNVTTWQGTCYVTPLIGAVLADAYWGRYWTIAAFSTIYFIFQTTAPKSCFMRPPGAILAPGESIIVTVFKFVEPPENNEKQMDQKSRVKFKIMSLKPMSMVLPGVVGFKLLGKLRDGVTATDLVLTVTQMLRKHGVVGKFVEFYGEGMGKLSLADRATIANMSPDYGATMGFFPVDHLTLQYLQLTGRSDETIAMIESYLRTNKMFVDYNEPQIEKVYSSYLELKLEDVELCISGAKEVNNSRGAEHRDDEDDSVAKMKAAEEALEAKQKVTNSLSATCSFFFILIMFYNFVTNSSWYSEDIYGKLPYDSIVFILHGCTMYFLTSLINFMCGV